MCEETLPTRLTLNEFYAAGGRLIENYSTGTYLSVTDSATFKDLFDKMYGDRYIGSLTVEGFQKRWERHFFATCKEVAKQSLMDASDAAASTMVQTTDGEVNTNPQGGTEDFVSGTSHSAVSISPETRLNLNKEIRARGDTISDYVKTFAKVFYGLY